MKSVDSSKDMNKREYFKTTIMVDMAMVSTVTLG